MPPPRKKLRRQQRAASKACLDLLAKGNAAAAPPKPTPSPKKKKRKTGAGRGGPMDHYLGAGAGVSARASAQPKRAPPPPKLRAQYDALQSADERAKLVPAMVKYVAYGWLSDPPDLALYIKALYIDLAKNRPMHAWISIHCRLQELNGS